MRKVEMSHIIDKLKKEVEASFEQLSSKPVLQIVCDDLEENKANYSYYRSIYNMAAEIGVEIVIDRYKKFDLPTLYLTGRRDTFEYDIEDYSTTRAVLYLMKELHPFDSVVLIAGRNRFGKEIREGIENTTDNSVCMINSKTTLEQKQNLVDAADFVISATGNSKTFDGIDFPTNSILIDVGRGDFGDKKHNVRFQTPPTNGVGKLTVLMLLKRVIQYYLNVE